MFGTFATAKLPAKANTNPLKNKQFAFRVFIDAGHGGISPIPTRYPGHRYTTFPNKAYEHEVGDFHQRRWFYEGVWNRQVAAKVEIMLDELGIDHLSVYHDYIDTPLKARYTMVNRMEQYCAKSLLVSLHANASPTHTARGYEVYTSPGKTQADWIAEQHYKHTSALFGDEIKYRADTTDKDHDREARFTMLTKTNCPAILVEHLFFDNYQDATLLMQDDVIWRFAKATVLTICDFMDLYKIPYGPDKISQI